MIPSEVSITDSPACERTAPGSRRVAVLLVLVLFAGFAARLAVGLVFYPPEFDQESNWSWHRTSDYWEIAQNLAEGKGYSYAGLPTAMLTPAVPLFLAGYLKVAGAAAAPLVVIQALMAALTGYLVFRLGRDIFSAGAGVVGAAMHALNPYLARLDVSVAEAAPYTLLLALLMLALLRAGRRDRTRDYLLAGLILGVTFLARPTVGAFAPLAALWLLIVSRRRSAALVKIGLMAATCLLVVSPWVIRNHQVFGRLVLTRTNGGQNLWFGNNEHLEAVYPMYSLDCLKPVLREKWYASGRPRPKGIEGYLARQDFYGELAKRHIRAEPELFARRFLEKAAELYTWRLSPVYTNFPEVRLEGGALRVRSEPKSRALSVRLAYGVPHGFLLIFTLAGLLAARGRTREVLPLLLLLLTNTVVYAVYFGTTKNRAPTDIFLMVIAGWGVVALHGKLRRIFARFC